MRMELTILVRYQGILNWIMLLSVSGRRLQEMRSIRLLIISGQKEQLLYLVYRKIRVPINTRMVLEKGLRIFGSSRSGYEDFKGTIELYHENRDVQEYLERLISDIVPIKTMKDMNTAFDTDIKKPGGKTIMLWEK